MHTLRRRAHTPKREPKISQLRTTKPSHTSTRRGKPGARTWGSWDAARHVRGRMQNKMLAMHKKKRPTRGTCRCTGGTHRRGHTEEISHSLASPGCRSPSKKALMRCIPVPRQNTACGKLKIDKNRSCKVHCRTLA